MTNTPLFSILHTSARPNAWRAVYNDWLETADHPEQVEYVLVVDKRWGFEELPVLRPQDKVLWNVDRKCYVEGVNIAARASTGTILIVNADDQFAAHCWDTDLRDIAIEHDQPDVGIQNDVKAGVVVPAFFIKGEFVVWASTGTQNEFERGLMVMPILSRARFEKHGYVFFPMYESMYADRDFYEHAKLECGIIEARELMFPHRHPFFDPTVKLDAAYEAQNRKEAYALGEKIIRARRISGFRDDVSGLIQDVRLKVLFCLPGDTFSNPWLNAFIATLYNLGRDYDTFPTLAQGSHVHIVRQCLANGALTHPPRPDYVVWIDSDNLVTAEQIRMLITDLECNPEMWMAAGWSYCVTDGYAELGGDLSVGYFDDKGVSQPMPFEKMARSQTDLIEIGYSGFPLVVMPLSTIERLGRFSFAPIMCEDHPWGFHPEDVSFCKRIWAAGGKVFVDRRVQVPHLKLRAAEPIAAKVQVRELVEK